MSGKSRRLVLAAVLAMLAALLVSPGAMAAQSSEFVALKPYRVIDSRYGTGGLMTKLEAGATLPVAIGGAYGVPANAGAASFNVTITEPEGAGFLTVYPCGTPRPLASNLNFTAGLTVPNAVLSRLGRPDSSLPRSICVYSSARTHLIIDLNGYFPPGADYQGMVPFRAADTRSGLGVPSGKVPAGATLAVPVTDRQAVLADAAAVTVNVTVTEPSSAGYVTLWPCGEARPFASNLNFVAGRTAPNAAIAGVGDNGSICLYTTATTHIVVDIGGYFTEAAQYAPLVPERVFDTRAEPDGKLPATRLYEVQIAEPGELVAAVLNVTVTQPESRGFITVYPCNQDLPLASNLNYVGGQTVPNMVIAPVDSDGRVCFYSSATTHLLADLNGVFPVGTPTTRETVPVYYLVDAAGDIRIAREFHTAEITSSRAAAAVELMLSVPPADPDYLSPWNPATTVRSVVVANNLITVDLSADARIASVGADAAESAVQQLIYTVTAAEQRNVPVALLIEGQPAGDLWGHVVWDRPISRAPILDTRLLVQINDPAEGTSVPSTFTVTGEAATFEAVLPWRITDGAGTVVQSGTARTAEGFVMSPFEFTIAFTGQPGTYTLEVRQDDPSGGAGGPVMTDDKTIMIG